MSPAGSVLLAHPFTEPSALALPPWSLATLAIASLVVATRVQAPRAWSPRSGERDGAGLRAEGRAREGLGATTGAGATTTTTALAPALAHLGPLPAGAVITRGLAVAVLLLVIATGRLGRDVAVGNLAPSVAVGLAVPVLLIAVLVHPRTWAWLDPFDALGRVVAPLGAGGGQPPVQDDVRWAAAGALGWVWYLGAHPAPLSPSAVGAALALYVVIMLAGCLAFGREHWLARAEVFGVLFGWVAELRAAGPRGWAPPRGAELVLGVLAGGLVFATLRLSSVWFAMAASPHADLLALAGSLGGATAGAGLLAGLARRVGSQAPGLVAAASVPAVVGLALAASLDQDRLVVAALLLPSLLSDPFGFGWDLFGTADATVVVLVPLGVRVAIQVAMLVVGGIAGVVVARVRTRDQRRTSATAAAAVGVLVAAGVLAVTAV